MSPLAEDLFKTKSGKVVIFRRCESSDVDAFIEFQKTIANETTHTLQRVGEVLDPEKIRNVWEETQKNPSSLRLGVFGQEGNPNRMIAQLICSTRGNHPWTNHIGQFGMMVIKDYWGESIGSKLLERMETHAQEHKMTRIEAQVRTHNERGIRLYLKSGYRIEGIRKNAALIDGVLRDEYFIAKLLDSKKKTETAIASESVSMEQKSKNVFKSCRHRLSGHSYKNTSEVLIELANKAEGVEADFYGSGKIIESFEREIAQILGKESAVFLPSGTMAQLIAARIWADEKGITKIGFHPLSHLEMREQLSYRYLHHLEAEKVGEAHRPMGNADIDAIQGPLAMLLLELPQRELGGTLPTWDELQFASKWAKKHHTALHMDGARLWESAPYYRKSHSEICALFDSVYVSFYKGVGGIAGAALAGSKDFIEKAKIWQRRHGGNLISLYPYVISAREGLKERLAKMPLYLEKAQEIAEILKSFSEIEIMPVEIRTSRMKVYLMGVPEVWENAALKIADQQSVALFRKLQKDELNQKYFFEFAAGDATLEMSADQIRRLFENLIQYSKSKDASI